MDAYLKGVCQLCGGHIEFPEQALGSTTPCPHCGKNTRLKPSDFLFSEPSKEDKLVASLSRHPVAEDNPFRRPVIKLAIYTFVLMALLGSLILAVNYFGKLASQRASQNQQPVSAPAPLMATNGTNTAK